MTTFRDCLTSAIDQGVISREAAADLDNRFQTLWAQKRLELGDGPAAAAAKDALEQELRFQAIEARRQAKLQMAAQDKVKAYVQGFRAVDGRADIFDATLNLIENFGSGIGGIQQRTQAIIGLAHSELTDVLGTFRRRGISGKRDNRPAADAVARELHGEGTGDEAARTMAQAVSSVFEGLRQRYNAVGGSIAKLEGYGLPHSHDAAALMKVGRDPWKEFIAPMLGPARMRDPQTGGSVSSARLDSMLDAAFDNITTGGWANRDPSRQPVTAGKLANQRQEHRVLVFKDADSWLRYDQVYGVGDPVVSIFNHINGMARDIAAMEVLGPNPNATIEWLKQWTAREFANHQTGKPSLYREIERASIPIVDSLPKILPEKGVLGVVSRSIENRKSLAEAAGGSVEYLTSRIDHVWSYARGRGTMSPGVAGFFGTTRNLLTSALLGSASLTAAATDPFIDLLARRVSGLPHWSAVTAITKTFSTASREEAVRAGLVLDDFLNILKDEARFTTISTGASEWSKWLADRTLVWSGLSPMTQARRHVIGMEWMGYVADNQAKAYDALPDRLRAKLQAYGITPSDWQIMQSVQAYKPAEGSAGVLRPADIAAKDRETAERFLALIYGETERHVPQGTIRSRSAILAGQQRGSVGGEIIEGMLQFKSFGLSFTTLQLQAIQSELASGKRNGAAYASALAIALTLGGGMAIQLANIANGRDPQPVNDPKFALAAMQRGGGFGLFGDFMFSDQTRFGAGMLKSLAGPTAALFDDLGKATVGTAQKALTGKKTNPGRDAINLVRRYTPVASSLWPTRAAYHRVMMDQLQYLADPDAHQAFRDAERRFEREQGGSFFWQPGTLAPQRAPTLEKLTR